MSAGLVSYLEALEENLLPVFFQVVEDSDPLWL